MNETVRMQDFTISTVGGKKIIKIFRGTILIYERGEAHKIRQARFHKVYFSPSAHLSGNRVLLPADFLNETQSDGESDGNEIYETDENSEKQTKSLLSETAISETVETETDEKQKNNKNKDKAKAKQRGEKR